MRRAFRGAVVLAVLAAVPAGEALVEAGRPPARLLVSADEFRLTLSRGSIRAGSAIVQLVNDGEDDHDLALRRSGGRRTLRISTVRPGRLGQLDAALLAGRYVLWCSLGDHRARGMEATLMVVRRTRTA